MAFPFITSHHTFTSLPELLTPPLLALLSFLNSFQTHPTLLFLCHATCFFSNVVTPPERRILLTPSLLAHLRLRAFRTIGLNIPEVVLQITKVLRPILLRAW